MTQPSAIPTPTLPLGPYVHFKGGHYTVLMLATHSETEEPLVIYRAEQTGGIFARPLLMFTEQVLHAGHWQPRFAPVTAE
ncbi:MAG: DUF1653 domain-containing protein [Aeromonas sp.]